MSSPRKPKKADITFWEERRGTIQAQKGGWVIGEAVHNQGFSMLDDLVGETSFFQVLVLNAVGRLPERRLADWLEAFFICLSWPDHRVWCNQMGSLGGTMQTTPLAAVTAGILASDSTMYGTAPLKSAAEFIVEALTLSKGGLSVTEIIRQKQRRPGSRPTMVGFARPVASGDERVAALERVTEKLGFAPGEHLGLAYEIEQRLSELFGEGMHIGGYTAAFLSDQGLSPEEMYRVSSILVCSGVHACYAETAGQPPESFFPLRCSDIDYQGAAERSVPDQCQDQSASPERN